MRLPRLSKRRELITPTGGLAEVAEYRPYGTDDPGFTHLRDELAKYNPASGVVDSIVSVLTP
jgi:hypothetical protein